MDKVSNIRFKLNHKLINNDFVIDKNGGKVIELIGQSFIADEESIFGTVNHDWNQRELDWYLSQSLNVNHIPGETPAIWKQVADKHGSINSNYGWCIFSNKNHNQYLNVLDTLTKNPDSRRGEMIYTRPSMQTDYNINGRSDFMCTGSVSYFIRDNKLTAHVKMRSNDVTFGYKGDYHWQKYVLDRLAKDLNVESGDIIWTASSLHVYDRHFYLVK